MSRARQMMRARLGPQPPDRRWQVRNAGQTDREALAALLIAAYTGTIDDGGETPEEALAEIDRTLGGAYGPFLAPSSFVVEAEGALIASTLITRWSGAPLVAFVMVDPRHQRRGLGAFVLRRSMAALWEQGERELALFVTEGNTPAERLYVRLGFTVVTPGG